MSDFDGNICPECLSEKGKSMDDKTVLNSALKNFGVPSLALLLKLFDDIREESGFGGLEVAIVDGKVQTIKKTSSYKVVKS
jgi:hypothetical protein